MCCRKLNYINDDVMIFVVKMYNVSDGNDGDVTDDDDGD